MDFTYDFKEDFALLIEQLREENYSKNELYTQTLKDILKEEKKQLYKLKEPSKLAIDKAFYKHNYKNRGPFRVEIVPLNLWDFVEVFILFHSLVMVDKKNNLLKMIGGIPLNPIRKDFVMHVVYYAYPKQPEFQEVAPRMHVHKMDDKELEQFKEPLRKAREIIKSKII